VKKFFSFIFLFSCISFNASAYAQQVTPKLEFLMSIDLKLDPSVVIDKNMRITQIASGVVNGPNIKGTVQPPSADWVQVLPSGVVRLDVRLLVKTDEGEAIYISYNGVFKHSDESLEKQKKGEEITPYDGWYAYATPTFRTASKKYDYLNGIQAVNRVKAFRLGADGGYARVDIFALK
jgi:hypothetical protein